MTRQTRARHTARAAVATLSLEAFFRQLGFCDNFLTLEASPPCGGKKEKSDLAGFRRPQLLPQAKDTPQSPAKQFQYLIVPKEIAAYWQ
jgi:hypothetical protein